MEDIGSRSQVGDATDPRPLPPILIVTGLVLAALILVVAIYAGAFITLAPMMH